MNIRDIVFKHKDQVGEGYSKNKYRMSPDKSYESRVRFNQVTDEPFTSFPVHPEANVPNSVLRIDF
ncbi:hypothetical protein Maes01_02309 [Microbulbifer aestuariivivens]|uniref:Uncharacterized protein n=1 Tax=Microbulbifer aestuariivivens TaxID=1908308 RepID=A0ABP9WRB4_9GAMM